MGTINKYADIFDSMDVAERLKELYAIKLRDLCEDEVNELENLQNLLGIFGKELIFNGGITFVNESFFEQHAKDVAYNAGAIDIRAEEKWLLESIDWKSAAEKLKKYYKHITFDGTDFWYRV